jgi:hypothetical protein
MNLIGFLIPAGGCAGMPRSTPPPKHSSVCCVPCQLLQQAVSQPLPLRVSLRCL